MAHDARAVANKLLNLAKHDGNRLTVLQLIKLVYFCNAWMLALYDRPLIQQPIEVWRYGPVVPDVYQSFKKYRNNPIKSEARVPDEKFDDDETHIVDEVYRNYGYLSGIKLSQLAHSPGTPWERVWNANGRDAIIPHWMLKEYYAGKFAAAQASREPGDDI